jgi:hypothetical protein
MSMAATTNGTIERIEQALHDLCQPLTVLQCKLELGLLSGGEDAIHAAMRDGLHECRRLNASVVAMRDLLKNELEPGTDGA